MSLLIEHLLSVNNIYKCDIQSLMCTTPLHGQARLFKEGWLENPPVSQPATMSDAGMAFLVTMTARFEQDG